MLGNDEPIASVPGEIVPSREFYDYEAKYLDGASRLAIPADVPDEMARAAAGRSPSRRSAPSTAPGLSRVDFLVDGESGDVFVNEINTMPGFTTISMYSKLWAATGLTLSRARRSTGAARARAPRREAAAARLGVLRSRRAAGVARGPRPQFFRARFRSAPRKPPRRSAAPRATSRSTRLRSCARVESRARVTY